MFGLLKYSVYNFKIKKKYRIEKNLFLYILNSFVLLLCMVSAIDKEKDCFAKYNYVNKITPIKKDISTDSDIIRTAI